MTKINLQLCNFYHSSDHSNPSQIFSLSTLYKFISCFVTINVLITNSQPVQLSFAELSTFGLTTIEDSFSALLPLEIIYRRAVR
jgi:hypothetical protein